MFDFMLFLATLNDLCCFSVIMEIATSRALEAEVKLAALHLDSKPTVTRPKPQYLAVSEEDDEEPIELPCEEDGCLLMSTLQGQFPGASGLQYRNPESNTLRGIRLSEGRLFPPDSAKSFVCVFPKGILTIRYQFYLCQFILIMNVLQA